MEDWHLEASHGGHLRVDMKRVPVVAKSVKESLVSLGHLFLNKVRFTLGRLGECGLNSALVAKSAKSAHEQTRSHRRLKLTS